MSDKIIYSEEIHNQKNHFIMSKIVDLFEEVYKGAPHVNPIVISEMKKAINNDEIDSFILIALSKKSDCFTLNSMQIDTKNLLISLYLLIKEIEQMMLLTSLTDRETAFNLTKKKHDKELKENLRK